MEHYDLMIIGGGPAGLTAGLYGSRAGMKTAVIEQGAPGGQAILTAHIENYPGYPQGIGGPELMLSFWEQALAFGVDFINEKVLSITMEGDYKKIVTADGEYQTKAVIIATGSQYRLMDIPGEKELTGHGVSYCAICDGAFYRDKKILVVGGGDAAVEEAVFLTQFSPHVYLCHRSDTFRATAILQKRLAESSVTVMKNTKLLEIAGEKKVERVLLETAGEAAAWQDFAAVFIFIGTLPNTEFLRGVVNLDERGYIPAGTDLSTSAPGIFAAGDVIQKQLRQVSTAVGDGAIAAMSSVKYIQETFPEMA